MVFCAFNIDYHDVVDTIGAREKEELAVELSKISIPSFLCSFGWGHADDIVEESTTCPLMSNLNGLMFTKHREHQYRDVDVDRPEGWPTTAIRIKGDKSFLSRLLRIPVLLLDDKGEAGAIHEKGHEGNRTVVSKRGRKRQHKRLEGHFYENRPAEWPAIVGQFAATVWRATRVARSQGYTPSQ